MSKIHSQTLFHFTNKEGLIGILTNNYLPKYSRERFYSQDGEWDYWVPIICFCDIPLSLITEHIAEFGNYGIGMSREWAYSSSLNPVIYYTQSSTYYKAFNELMTLIHENSSIINTGIPNKDNMSKIKKLGLYLFHYYKPHTGYDFKKNCDKCFYDEREWRYVPYLENNSDLIIVHDDNIETSLKENYLNMNEFPLFFEPKDVKYIIIHTETERLEIIRKLREIKGKYSHDDVEVLVSKILTCEQINNDI